MSVPDGFTPANMHEADALVLKRASSCPFDPNAAIGTDSDRYRLAATGDLATLQTIRDQCMQTAMDGGTAHPHALVMASELLIIARLCAAHRQPEDARQLAGALCFTSSAFRHVDRHDAADLMTGEMVTILEQLAAAGDEYCAIASEQMVGLHPRASVIARTLMNVEK